MQQLKYNFMNKRKKIREVRHKRVRAKVLGTALRPRLSVYRSNKHLFLQLIDDSNGKTLVGISDKIVKLPKKSKKIDLAYAAGKVLAERAKEKKIESVVFDRGGYKYHGRVLKVAEGAREGGLKF